MSSDERLTWDLTDSFNEDFSNYSKVENRNSARENQAFIYPGPYARNISGTNTDAKMRRGFMRSIIMGDDIAKQFGVTGPGNLRLNFQFNPEYIERRVSQSPGAVNPLLQNPANLTQAVPGTAQFNFTMTFNREAEVALSRDRLNFDSTTDDEDGIRDGLKDPGKVGVMHDLAIFDKIIGQGISEELVNIITAYTRQQTAANNNAAASNVNNDNDDSGSAITEFNETAFRDSINANFGNSAFLNPMPVRIVFSDLFMVEGLIVGSAVAFQKFSQNMIPTVCQVNCEVYALYVGFAKKKAFLTNNLTDWAKTSANDAAKNATDTNAAKSNMAKRVKRVYVVMNSSDTTLTQQDRENLEVPDFNSDAMKILAPTITNLFYQGNLSNNNDRFVTLPQWYNAFATPTPLAYRQAYTYDQDDNSSTKVGKLPISVWLEYAPIEGQKLDGLDAEFDIKVDIKDLSTQAIKGVGIEPGIDWEENNRNSWGISIPGQDKNRMNNKLYRRVFWLDPVDVAKKNGISSTAPCEFNVTLTMRQNVAGISEKVSLDFKPIKITYGAGAPLYRKGNDQHKAIAVKQATLQSTLGRGGVSGGRVS